MRFVGVYIIVLLLAGCTQEVIPYCQKDSDCPPGMTCNTALYSCYLVVPDGGSPEAAPFDLAVDQPVDAGGDLPANDLPLPDLPPEDLPPLDLPLPDLPGVGAKCGGDTACSGGGGCVDGFCCDKPCQGLCEACDVSGKEGLCSAVPAGTDPGNECTGTKPCGKDMCNGQGACTVPAGTKKVCGSKCNASNNTLVEEFFCDGAGTCSTVATTRTCSPYICLPGDGVCATKCRDNLFCTATSACDASQLHKVGYGYCVAPSKVALVATVKDLQDEVSMQTLGTTSRTHIRLASKTYTFNFKWSGKTKLFIAADSGATFRPAPGSTEPGIVHVKDGANITLQSIDVDYSLAGQNGIVCQSVTPGNTSLTLLDSRIGLNSQMGLTANGCHVVARRNNFFNNTSTGVRVYNGSATLVNNLITGNGLMGSTNVGGVDLKPGAGFSVTFVNNTVADNYKTSTYALSAMQCQGFTTPLVNNLLYHKTSTTTQALATGCTFANSLVPQGGGKNGNFSKVAHFIGSYLPSPTLSPAIDAGQDVTAVTQVDRSGSPRPAIKNGKVDVGCYEMK